MNDTTGPEPEGPDAAFDRLRAADPAAGLAADVDALDAAVRQRIAAATHDATAPDELSVARARRGRAAWLSVAAVAAGALVFGSAGYALGNAGGSGDSTTAGAVITLGQQGSAEQGAASDAANAAPEMATSDVGRSALSYPSGYGSRTTFTSTGLSDAAGSAQAWAYDPAAAFNAATAERVAAALGLAGSAALVDGMWSIGPNDGTGPSLQLQPDGLASVNFYDPTRDPYACQASGAEPAEEGDGTDPDNGAVPLPGPPKDCATAEVGAAPQGDAAVAAARDLLGSLGVDADAFEYETQDSGVVGASYVSAYQVVDGERTGAAWSVGFAGDGIQSLNGPLAAVTSLGSYDLVSEQEAVSRLSDPRFGASYSYPMMYASGIADDAASSVRESAELGATTDLGTSTEVAPAPEPTLPPAVEPGSAFAWPVTEVTLTSARLGLTMYTLPDGASVLLPAYVLSSADGQSWSVVAVADSQLDFTPQG
ncbi:hypothetical protein [Pengzhenrongella sicca]|uniref:Uncharacterized protein n=1 Tax=Pengzhenrongella sicca TaxID=2819238 RepID=A0A8A4ZFQ4_9MICO|nr:hypothetical protein [Pengzhenrongella sicca]QTE29763.1 hypothetical protein J4E96_01575 [Pengzhenrongella sicca]